MKAMTKFTDHLWSDLAQEHGAALTQAGHHRPGRSRRPGLLAGGTLAAAVGGTALALSLTAGGTSAAAGSGRVVTDAYTITESSSSVVVQINQQESIVAANAKLSSMINEDVVISVGAGPATTAGAVTCTAGEPNMHGPVVKVLLGSNGTEVILPGTTGGNTGVGTWHLNACTVYPSADMGPAAPASAADMSTSGTGPVGGIAAG
jgi:hypothetical protein